MPKKYNFHKAQDLATKLLEEITSIAESRHPRDWDVSSPSMGSHYYIQEIHQSENFKSLKNELLTHTVVSGKYSSSEIEKPILRLIDAVLTTSLNPNEVVKALDYFWEKLVELFYKSELSVLLIHGLRNFDSKEPKFLTIGEDLEIIKFDYRQSPLRLWDYFNAWDLDPNWRSNSDLERCNGAIIVRFSVDANADNLIHHQYVNQCIKKFIKCEEALRLSGFGRLITGPWIAVCNPEFPINHVNEVSSPRFSGSFDGPTFLLDDITWERFLKIREFLGVIAREEEIDEEFLRGARRRFLLAIQKFNATFDQGMWETVLLDFVMILESIYLPESPGGKLKIALAASNLLGTTNSEAMEVFDNLSELYNIRNKYVHGDPIPETTWQNYLTKVANNSGITISSIGYSDWKWHTFEVLRDYVRRSLDALLTLHYSEGLHLSRALTDNLLRLHFDDTNRIQIHKRGNCYPLAKRPPFTPRHLNQ